MSEADPGSGGTEGTEGTEASSQGSGAAGAGEAAAGALRRSFGARLLAALKLEAALFEEVEHDPGAMG